MFTCHFQLQDAVSGVRVIVTGPSQTEEEEDFPPPPPDISGLHIGENAHRELRTVLSFSWSSVRAMNHFSDTKTFPFSQRQEQCNSGY